MLGFAGLVGSGRTEVAESLFGVWPADTGIIRRGDVVVEIDSPREAMDHGIAYVSEDRRRLGLSLPQSVTTNITLAGLRRFVSRWRLVDRDAERRAADIYRQRLRHPHAVAVDAGRQPVGRQPAEGDARQVARRQAVGARSSTSRPAASTSAPRPTSTSSSASWRRRASR